MYARNGIVSSTNRIEKNKAKFHVVHPSASKRNDGREKKKPSKTFITK